MPLFSIRAYPGNACGDGLTDEFHVHAKDPIQARSVVVAWLLKEERYHEIETFADPRESCVNQIPSRAPQAVVGRYMHHCGDHS